MQEGSANGTCLYQPVTLSSLLCVDLGGFKGLGSSEDPSVGLDWRFFTEILLSI